MDQIRIKNLRCFEDTGYIDIKPLTVLVGKNSSGKSTFLRFFPLMKQTIETRTNEPILWYSSRYVDFGSFMESLNINSKKRNEHEIIFEFSFTVNLRELYTPFRYVEYEYFRTVDDLRTKFRDRENTDDQIRIKLKLVIEENNIKEISLSIEDHTIKLELSSPNKLIINNDLINDVYYGSKLYSSILPTILYLDKKEETKSKYVRPIEKRFTELLFEKFSVLLSSNTERDTIMNIINELKFGDSKTILNSIKNIDSSSDMLVAKLENLDLEDDDFIKIKNYFIGLYLNSIIENCNEKLESFFKSVNYIAPIRASVERYYRLQGLAIDEVDPQGENIPMLLNNMKDTEKKDFQNWVEDNFGFQITTNNSERGHTSLEIKYNDGQTINMADTGFGYSQFLPIILVLWQSTKLEEVYRNKKRRIPRSLRSQTNFIIAIEQPELHLHPLLQAKLIDTFAKILSLSKKSGFDVRIIIETHSETIVNRIGYLIAKKYENFNNDLVNVLIFDQENQYSTTITKSGYTEDGYLSSWPIGFFAPEGI